MNELATLLQIDLQSLFGPFNRKKMDFDKWHAWKIEDFMRCKDIKEIIDFCENTAKWLKEDGLKIEWEFNKESNNLIL